MAPRSALCILTKNHFLVKNTIKNTIKKLGLPGAPDKITTIHRNIPKNDEEPNFAEVSRSWVYIVIILSGAPGNLSFFMETFLDKQ